MFVKRFSEGSSIEGTVVDSSLSLWASGFAPTAVRVGCISHETGSFKQQKANGVLGLSQGRTSLLHVLLSSGRITRNAFSLCARLDGGLLSLGSGLLRDGQPQAVATATTARTPLYIGKSNGFYFAHAVEWAVAPAADLHAASKAGARALLRSGAGVGELNDRRLAAVAWQPINKNAHLPVVIDSGSTSTYLPSPVVTGIVAWFQQHCTGSIGESSACGAAVPLAKAELPQGQVLCLKPSMAGASWAATVAQLPSIAVVFEDGADGSSHKATGGSASGTGRQAVWIIAAKHAFHKSEWTDGLHCLGIYPSEEASGRSVLGLNSMHDREVTFDVDGGTLSWTDSDCGEGASDGGGVGQAHGAVVTGDIPDSNAALAADLKRLDVLSLPVEPSHGPTAADRADPGISATVALAIYGAVLGLVLVLFAAASLKAYRTWKASSGTSYTALGAPSSSAGPGAVVSAADDDDEDEDYDGEGGGVKPPRRSQARRQSAP